MNTENKTTETAAGSQNVRKQYRLQASTNTEIGGWQDTKFVSVHRPEVEREYVKLSQDPNRWIGGKIGQLRIVEAR